MITTASFSRISATPVPALGLTLETWLHPCGARHFHLACADEHRAFTAAFRTPPADSTGLPHILEHTALCGSRRYPVRDPFFQMLRRSLQTFMNAMTFPDLTAYPFATQVTKDFDNLLHVYLDAVFAPLLDELDFAQEGHRLEPEKASDNASETAPLAWSRKGVVFNEMKGAMDSTSAQLDQAAARLLLVGTCYEHNSGGEPADIPRLHHADLVAFHRRCYRPANAVLITYGAVDLEDFHRQASAYLVDEPGAALPPPTLAQPLTAPIEADVPVPWAEGQDELDVTATTLTWLWGDSADIDEALTAELLDRLLLDHAGAPLRHAIEASGLARALGGSGYQSHYRNGAFVIEVDGLPVADYAKFPALVLDTLTTIARDGIAPADVDAALHQVELARREIHGDSYPYGLELCFRLLSPWNHGVDPLPFLDQAPAIARLRERAAAPDFIAREIRTRFLDNPSRLWLRAQPDRAFHTRAQDSEQAQVAVELARLNEREQATLRAQADRLAVRQARHDDPAVLPDLDLADVPGNRRWAEGRTDNGVTIFTAGTNGLLHALVALPLPALTADELDLLPLVTQFVSGLGVGARTYDQQATWLNARCGGLSAWTDIGAAIDDAHDVGGWWLTEVKGLADRQADFLPLLSETLHGLRFDERDRLRELIDTALQRLQERVASGGSQHATRAALRGQPGAAGLGHRLAGLGRLAWLKRTATAIDEDAVDGDTQLDALAAACRKLLAKIVGGPRQLAVFGDAAARPDVLSTLRGAWPNSAATNLPPFTAPTPPAMPDPTAFTTASAVNYCALVFPAVPVAHVDAAVLAVAARLLTNNQLHPLLREQGGAYGGGASYDGGRAAVALSSFRDPRLAATFTDMRAALRWLADCPDDARLLKEAVLGVLAGLDSPGSPAGEARQRFCADLKGTGPAFVSVHRRRILSVSTADIRRVAARWLPADGGLAAAVTSAPTLAASGLGWSAEAI